MTDTELWSIKEVANAFKKHGIIQDQEPSGDLISRQAVIDAIKHAQFNFQIISTINFADYKKEVQEIVDNILSAQIKAINDLPSVNPQEPKADTWSIKDVADTLAKHGLIVEQEPKTDVLDKIRAEIEELADADGYGDYQLGFSFGLMMAMEIIDKYRAESEAQ